MFKSLWNSLSSQKGEEARGAMAFDRAKLRMLNEHFHIGRKLKYYPEYQRDIVFESIIIAYCVNGQFIYSRDAVLTDREDFPTGFRVAGSKVLPLEDVERVQLLLPDTSEMEKTLSYITRAVLGRAGQFRPGNAMTLLIDSEERSIPTVDTIVDRRQVMKAGPYEGSSTVLVTPVFESLILADKRRKQRVETAIRADLYLAPDASPSRCLLGDFSELSLRLQTDESGAAMPPMESGMQVVVEFEVGDPVIACRFRGKIFRRTDEFCVIDIEHLYKFGEFEKVKMLDIMEIKTALLNLRH